MQASAEIRSYAVVNSPPVLTQAFDDQRHADWARFRELPTCSVGPRGSVVRCSALDAGACVSRAGRADRLDYDSC